MDLTKIDCSKFQKNTTIKFLRNFLFKGLIL